VVRALAIGAEAPRFNTQLAGLFKDTLCSPRGEWVPGSLQGWEKVKAMRMSCCTSTSVTSVLIENGSLTKTSPCTRPVAMGTANL